MTALKTLLIAQAVAAAGGLLLPRRWAKWIWFSVLPLGLAAVLTRWAAVGHPPMRNLFEAFLWLPPLTGLCTALTRWRRAILTLRTDALLGLLVAIPLAFVFDPAEGMLPPALQSPFFVPHVLAYMIAYVLMARGCLLSLCRAPGAAGESIGVGFFFMTGGLVLGSVWGNEVWGSYWQWDPKEMWALATWLIYCAWFCVRGDGKLRTALSVLGLLAIMLTVTWVNLSRLFEGVHSYAGL